jgi:hypothetical protein
VQLESRLGKMEGQIDQTLELLKTLLTEKA